MNKMKVVKIINAKYLDEYKIKLRFNDNSVKIIDFKSLLLESNYPNEKNISILKNLKNFKLILY
jgi:hypothetical protein